MKVFLVMNMMDSHSGTVLGVFANELSAFKFLEGKYASKGNYRMFVYEVQP